MLELSFESLEMYVWNSVRSGMDWFGIRVDIDVELLMFVQSQFATEELLMLLQHCIKLFLLSWAEMFLIRADIF